MNLRTRISGWDVTVEPPRPMEVFVGGHVSPGHALHVAKVEGLFVEGHVTIEHQIVDLPKWYKETGGALKPANCGDTHV